MSGVSSDAWSGTGSDVALAVDELPVGRCDDCAEDALVLDRALLQYFALRVCIACRQDRNLRDGAYEFVSKSRAKSDFALPDSFFHGLPYMSKPNPRHESFAPLKLYLKQTIVREAHRLYGSQDGLENELEARRLRAYASAAKRTKHLLKRKHVLQALDSDDTNSRVSKRQQEKSRDESQQQQQQQQSQSLNTTTKRLHHAGQPRRPEQAKPAYVPVADRDHKHTFAAEVHDTAANAWFKECACGMKVEVEKW